LTDERGAMSTVTVREFAAEVKIPVDLLLMQLQAAGVSVEGEDAPLTEGDKRALLTHLQERGGAAAARPAATEPRRISLKRKTTTELKLGTGRGATRTVSIEVRKRRTYVKRDAEAADPDLAAAEAEAAAREQAERESTARAAAEAEAKRLQEEAERKLRSEEEAQRLSEEQIRQQAEEAALRAAAEAQADAEAAEAVAAEAEAGHQPQEIVDPARKAAEAARRRAEENLRRAEEMKRAPPPVEAPKAAERPVKRERQELKIPGGKGRRERKAKKPGRVKFETQHAFERPTAPVVREIEVPENITVGDLANRMAVKTGELIKVLMRMGVMATINQSLDQDTAVLVVEEVGHKARAVSAQQAEDTLLQAVTGEVSDAELLPRPPIVTVMGHVDHGKTSLLDYIRKSRVAAGEHGGITQHIGAYHVRTEKGVISFLDTPGHAAFTRMRARGAQVTDIVVLVVAADDGVMPQTREAIQHARAAGVPMVVAITKVDKPEADAERIKSELTKEEVVVEDWGGDIQCVAVSAHTGEGVDALLDALVLQAEVLELKAPVEAPARGMIIESSVEKGRGPVATVLVRSGTLRQGDVILTGPHFGRVRAMFDEAGKPAKSVGPSIPVQVLGLSGAPDAGDEVVVVADERKARELADLREIKLREQKLAQAQAVRMEQVFARMQEGEGKHLNLMIKADVHGSAEALQDALRKIPSEEVRVNIISVGVGGISESDVDLALASQAIIIGFNTRADGVARRRIQETGVDVRYYSIIYDVIDDVTDAIGGLLGTETREQIVGVAQVRDVFRSSKLGNIAGCLVMDGEVRRGLPIRVLRDNVVVYEGELESLRRFKDDVNKVEAGTECGIGVKNYNDIKAGDQIECFDRIQVKRTVQVAG
jgi:translation initiation factor IF-2